MCEDVVIVSKPKLFKRQKNERFKIFEVEPSLNRNDVTNNFSIIPYTSLAKR